MTTLPKAPVTDLRASIHRVKEGAQTREEIEDETRKVHRRPESNIDTAPKEFLEYCEWNNIIPLALPSHTTHILQPLDVCVFQPLKHWHAEAINEAAQMGDEKFNKLEFLNAFNDFRAKAFQSTTIRSAWRQTGLIPYNPALVLDKVREAHPPAPPRPVTPPSTKSYEFEPLQRTPHTIRELARAATTILMTPNVPQSLLQPLSSLVKGAVAGARRGELMEARFDQ